MFDLLIKNGTLVDGTGSPPRKADLAIEGDEIKKIDRLKNASAKQIIDAEGFAITPGFIDSQNHSDSYWTVFDHPHQESLLLQGITTIAFGQCGASLAPLPSLQALKAVQKWHSLDGLNWNWQYFDEFLQILSRQELGVNVLSLIGHSTIRRGLLGDEVRPVTAAELKILERLVSSSFKAGATGMSLGLIYAHEYDASAEELLALSKLAKKFDRLLSVHLRSEGSQILEALDEVLDLAFSSGARVKISHLKIRGERNWHYFDQMLEKIERAYQKGAKVFFDFYPYPSSWSVLYTYLPKWAYEGGREELIKRVKQPFLRNKIVGHLREQAVNLSNVIIATASSAPQLVGRTLGNIAGDQGVSIEEALVNIISATESEVVVFEENINPDHLEQFIKHPLGMAATDGAGFSQRIKGSANLVHPRCFGSMVKFLAWATQKKLLSFEAAVHKITGLPALVLGLNNRGLIKAGKKADISIIDPPNLTDYATLQNPFQPPSGIRRVVVNGKLAVKDGNLTGEFAGQVIKA